MHVIDETQDDLRALIEDDFGPVGEDVSLKNVLLDWLHFRARRIPQRPREVLVSPEVKAKYANYPAIIDIKQGLSAGEDMSPWLSDSVRWRKDNPKADMMFNDWQIMHFHLGRIFARPEKVCRTGDLLFVWISGDRAVFLDVLPHDEWAQKELLEILLHISPEDIEPLELKGIMGSAQEYDMAERDELRRAGMTVPLEVNGRVFIPPGWGVTTSGHALRIVRFMSALLYGIQETHRQIMENRMPKELAWRFARVINLPIRLGIIFQAGHFQIVDKNRDLVIFISSPLE